MLVSLSQHWEKLKLLLLHDWVLTEIQTDVDALFQNRAGDLLVALVAQVEITDH